MPRFASDKSGLGQQLCGLLALLGLLVLQGCATHSAGFAKIEQAAASRNLPVALKSLDEFNLTGADQTLHHLNKGSLLRFQKDFAGSNRELDTAKRLIEELEATSISEQVASATINDTMKAYEGNASEQLLLYAFEALNYLELGDFDAAAVEARQFDIKHRLIMEKNPDAKYLSGAFVRYLNGMVYDAVGERDSARIEYQKALDGYEAQKEITGSGPPAALQNAQKMARGTGEVVFFLHNGLGPSLAENAIQVANPMPESGATLLRIALPKFVGRPAPVARVEISSGSRTTTSELAEDINAIAEKDLENRLPAITARAVARLVAKNIAVKKTKEKTKDSGAFGLLMAVGADIAAIASERADTRSWSLLPGNIQLARLALPPGTHDLKATYYGVNGNVLTTRTYPAVKVTAGRRVFLSDYYLQMPSIQ